jgi:hypothetical protein
MHYITYSEQLLGLKDDALGRYEMVAVELIKMHMKAVCIEVLVKGVRTNLGFPCLRS